MSKNAKKLSQLYSQDQLATIRATLKGSFKCYNVATTHGVWKPTKHTDLICNKLHLLEEGKIKNLIATLPPRHSKSMTITESFPSWFIGQDPERRAIIACYGDTLARKFGRRNRNKIKLFGEEIFDIKLASDSASISDWNIEGHRGGLVSTGIGGAITGEGADLLLVDDPIKNREEANSKVYREKVWDEWENTLLTRLHPGGRKLVIATRWHEDDLIGRLLEQEPEKWEVINLPCEAEENDALGREIGEPLWPEHGFDIEWMEDMKGSVKPAVWASLFQQRPSPQDGTIFRRDWFSNYYDELPEFTRLCSSWDMAFKKTSDSDFVVGQVWGEYKANKYLLYQVRARMSFTETKQAVINVKNMFPDIGAILIEDKANGPAIIDTFKSTIPGIIAIEPRGSKEARAIATTHYWEAGNVLLPRPQNSIWVGNFIEEHMVFPRGKNDDQVDATSQMLDYFSTHAGFDIKKIKVSTKKAFAMDDW